MGRQTRWGFYVLIAIGVLAFDWVLVGGALTMIAVAIVEMVIDILIEIVPMIIDWTQFLFIYSLGPLVEGIEAILRAMPLTADWQDWSIEYMAWGTAFLIWLMLLAGLMVTLRLLFRPKK